MQGNKEQVYEGGVRGVGFVNSPLIHRPGTENDHLMYITDWFATILTLGQEVLSAPYKLSFFHSLLSILFNFLS